MYDLKTSKEKQTAHTPVNKTGIPSPLKKNIEKSHNLSLDNVHVHYNSSKPAQLHAHAYTQGSHVFISPGQEKYLPHELGHVVQQMTGSITPTIQMNGVKINNNPTLEREADLLGNCLIRTGKDTKDNIQQGDAVQCFFYDVNSIDILIGELKYINNNYSFNLLEEYTGKLNQQHIINGHIEFTGHDNKYTLIEHNSPSIYTFDELCVLLRERVCNMNEQEKSQIERNVPFGNEFTFRSKSSIFNFNMLSLSSSNTNDVNIAAAGQIVAAWADTAPASCFADGTKFIKKVNTGNKKWKDAPYNAIEVVYEGYNPEKGPISWSFNIDLDPLCIEIQTKPITFETYISLRPLFDMAIFKTADRLGLFADTNPDTGGGGHISIDKACAFQNSAHYLRNFLVLYANEQLNPGSWVHQCHDSANAPFLFELGNQVISAFNAAIRRFDSLPADQQTIDVLVNIIQENVYKGNFMPELEAALKAQRTSSKKQKKSIRLSSEEAYHYQAVNLEHMLKTDATAHIEMRRYNAQQNTDELATQLQNLWNLLLLSRQEQNIPFLIP